MRLQNPISKANKRIILYGPGDHRIELFDAGIIWEVSEYGGYDMGDTSELSDEEARDLVEEYRERGWNIQET